MIRISLLAAALAAPLSAPLVAQAGAADQFCPGSPTDILNIDAVGFVFQTQVRAGVSGQLEGFEVRTKSNLAGQMPVNLRLGAGWNTGPAAWSGSVPASGSGQFETQFIDMSSANVQLSVGDVFIVEFVGGTGFGIEIEGLFTPLPATPPYPEPIFLNGPGCWGNCEWRMGFTSYMLAPSGPQLAWNGPCPGPGTLTVTGATPNSVVPIAWSFQTGSLMLGNGPCVGTTVGLANLRLLTALQTDANGDAVLARSAPPVVCGSVFLTGLDVASCTPTNVLAL